MSVCAGVGAGAYACENVCVCVCVFIFRYLARRYIWGMGNFAATSNQTKGYVNELPKYSLLNALNG